MFEKLAEGWVIVATKEDVNATEKMSDAFVRRIW